MNGGIVMGVLITLVLVFLNLVITLGMSWWMYSIIELLMLFLLLGLGTAVFYAEETSRAIAWRAHVGYWAVSLANVMGLYLATKASGLLLVLLVINLVALLRAISRLDAIESGIVWPVTEAGSFGQTVGLRATESPSMPGMVAMSLPGGKPLSGIESQKKSVTSYQPIAPLDPFPNWPIIDSSSMYSSSIDSSSKPGLALEPDVLLEDEPGVQVELETYKDGENAVPIIRTQRSYKDIDALMEKVSRGIGRARISSLKAGKNRGRFANQKNRKKGYKR